MTSVRGAPGAASGDRWGEPPAVVSGAERRLDEIAREMEEARGRVAKLRSDFQAHYKSLHQKRIEVETKDREIARLKQRAEELEGELVKLRDEIQRPFEQACAHALSPLGSDTGAVIGCVHGVGGSGASKPEPPL